MMSGTLRTITVISVVLTLASCSLFKRGGDGGYYSDDGPPRREKVDIASIPDAVPRNEPMSRTGNNTYTALGKRYRPMKQARGFFQRGQASWYGKKFHGRRTSSGETYDMYAMTAAHPTLPLPTYVRVTNLNNNRSVVVKVNDRGPFLHGRIIDLSYAAAAKLDIVRTGTGDVEVEAIVPGKQQVSQASQSSQATGAEINIPVAPSNANVYVQVAAFGNQGNALHFKNTLSKQVQHPVHVKPAIVAGNKMHRVWVGPFDSTLDADRFVPELARFASGYPTVVIDNGASF